MFARKELIIMDIIVNKNVNSVFTWGGINNTLVCLKDNNYDTESLRDQTLFIVVFLLKESVYL